MISDTLIDQCLYKIVAMNYRDGALSVCFNPSCSSPVHTNKKGVSNLQNTENNTILQFLDKDPLNIRNRNRKLFAIPVLEKCSGCHLMQYCSTKCQRQDWPRHKPNCRATNRMRLLKNIERTHEVKQPEHDTTTDNDFFDEVS